MKKFLILLPLLLYGCVSGWPPAQLPTASDMAAGWQKPAQPYSIKMRGEMMLYLPNAQYAAEHTLMIASGGQFRLEMFGPFEKRVFSIFCDGANMLAISYDENRAWYGAATPANLARFVGMDLNPGHIFMVLSGRAPFWLKSEDIAARGQVMASSNPGEILLMLDSASGPRQSITLKLTDLRVLEASLKEDDGRLFDIVYKRWQEDSGLPLSLELKASDSRGLSIYNDSARQQAFDKSDFSLPALPANMPVYSLD